MGEAARLSGVSAKMLRHYESLGLLGTVTRTDSGYRLYNQTDVHTLRFIKRCRDLGFSMAEIGELVGLWQNKRRASANVKKIAQKHMDELSERIAAMQAMQRTLSTLLHCCHGDDRPDCPILDDLAGDKRTATQLIAARAHSTGARALKHQNLCPPPSSTSTPR
uniref:Heavy metal-dependent transcription regulator 2 n=1 Tax=Curvibacter symbiont subsp. Hydra magnipapillata TaxID=667019 RepID=C9YCH0_CURXX|nr:Heavy metal-dependent transcription regulator 2 [Curvibacter putative symbiont of Hydra magnipapillata]